MAASKYKLIIWDWNGTLYADRDISLMTVNYILDKRGMPPITLEQYYSYVDTPITRFYEHLFDMSKVSFDEIGKDYYYAYGKYSESLTVSPEIAQLLSDLHRAGCVQKLVSGYEHGHLCDFVKKSGLDACFTHINGADNRRAESKHDRIEAAVNESGFDKSECVIIGDTEHEYQIASSLGVPCILVGWGHRPGEELIKCKCGYAGTVSELYGLLFENG